MSSDEAVSWLGQRHTRPGSGECKRGKCLVHCIELFKDVPKGVALVAQWHQALTELTCIVPGHLARCPERTTASMSHSPSSLYRSARHLHTSAAPASVVPLPPAHAVAAPATALACRICCSSWHTPAWCAPEARAAASISTADGLDAGSAASRACSAATKPGIVG